MKIKVSDYVLGRLSDFGVKQAFCVTGGASSHLMESLRVSNIKTIHNHHEQACAMAADSYARISKIPALVLCTNGPGVTNLVTGVAGAFQDSVPMIVITGQVSTKQMSQNSKFKLRQLGVQEIATQPLVQSITKSYEQIITPQDIVKKLDLVLNQMMTGRMGPVWVEIPLDIQSAVIDMPTSINVENKKQSNSLNLLQICSEINSFLEKSNRPVLVVGNGIHLSNTEKSFIELFHKLKIPTVSTWTASDLFSSFNELYIGNFGILGQRAANYVIQRADLLIILGARLSIPNIGYNTQLFAPTARKVMVDIDSNELNKETLTIDLKINEDLSKLLPHMSSELNAFKHQEPWKFAAIKTKIKLAITDEPKTSTKNFTDSYDFIDLLSASISGDEIIVTDMGTSFTCTMQAFKNNGKNRLLTSSSLSSMGFGLPGAIGAACASSEKNKVICISGDGGFQMNLQELQTLVDNDISVKVFVLNSKGYLAISIMQDNSFGGNYFGANVESGVSSPDFTKIAKAYGIESSHLSTNLKEARKEIEQIIRYQGSYVCEVSISPKQLMRPRVQSIKDADGKFQSGSIERMWPLLPPEIEIEINHGLDIKI
jgi:acetolactate synthase-1/2/3 large subunit